MTQLGSAAREAATSSPSLQKVGDNFRGLRSMLTDDQAMTPERFLVRLVDAVRVDGRADDRSTDDVYVAAKSRRRRLGLASFAAGPLIGVVSQLADLYCETAVVCDLSDVHGLDLTDEQIASHMLVLWSVTPSLDEAHHAILGTSQHTLAGMLAGQLYGSLGVRDLDAPITKQTAIRALWKARGVIDDVRRGPTAAAGVVVFAGRRTKNLIRRAERQLGAGGEDGVPPPPPARAVHPPAPPFAGFESKQEYLRTWAAHVFELADHNPAEHRAGVEEVARLAALTQMWYRLAAMAEGENSDISAYLGRLPRDAIFEIVDDMYRTVIQIAARTEGPYLSWGPGQAEAEVVTYLDAIFEAVFRDCLAEYVDGVRSGDFA